MPLIIIWEFKIKQSLPERERERVREILSKKMDTAEKVLVSGWNPPIPASSSFCSFSESQNCSTSATELWQLKKFNAPTLSLTSSVKYTIQSTNWSFHITRLRRGKCLWITVEINVCFGNRLDLFSANSSIFSVLSPPSFETLNPFSRSVLLFCCFLFCNNGFAVPKS